MMPYFSYIILKMKLPLDDKKFTWLLVAVILAVLLEILSIANIHVPMPYAPFIYGVFILAVGWEVLLNGVKSLFRLKFSSINLLMLIAVCAAFYLGEYPEATVVIVLYVLGEKLEDIGIESSMSALDGLVSNSPKIALVKESGQTVPVKDIKPGTVIQVKPYEQIPLDGIVESGESSVDESPITGEFIPKDKNTGDVVFAGTLNTSGFLEIKTTKLYEDTTFSKIIELTYESQKNRANSQKFIEKFAQVYTPIIIILAILLFVVPVFILGKDLDHWLLQAVTLLVISCPCALVISTPVAIYAALGNASSKGALIKGGKYVEALAEIRAIGLDKTRTITYGNPVVSDIIPLNDTDLEELLACSAGTETFSEHPLAKAIVEASYKKGFKPHASKSFESIAGEGVRSTCTVCNNGPVLIGKVDFIKKHHSVPDETGKTVERLSQEGKTSVIVSCEGKVKGILGLTDEIKPDSLDAIKALQAQGIETVMLTGDNDNAARFVAQSAGIQSVYGSLLPPDKSDKIKELISEYKYVAMVGDGINDAPALAASTVGIAMGAAGSDTAIEVADVALMNDKLSLIPFLIGLGKKTVKTIKRNTIGAIAVKIIFILLAFAGYSNLVFAIAADVGVTLIVILISLRLMKYQSGYINNHV